jgi:hypothetical protein
VSGSWGNARTFQDKDSRAALQEVLHHLDATSVGDRHIAWYGQCRAEGMTHAEALESAIEHFNLRRCDWYLHRFPELK